MHGVGAHRGTVRHHSTHAERSGGGGGCRVLQESTGRSCTGHKESPVNPNTGLWRLSTGTSSCSRAGEHSEWELTSSGR